MVDFTKASSFPLLDSQTLVGLAYPFLVETDLESLTMTRLEMVSALLDQTFASLMIVLPPQARLQQPHQRSCFTALRSSLQKAFDSPSSSSFLGPVVPSSIPPSSSFPAFFALSVTLGCLLACMGYSRNSVGRDEDGTVFEWSLGVDVVSVYRGDEGVQEVQLGGEQRFLSRLGSLLLLIISLVFCLRRNFESETTSSIVEDQHQPPFIRLVSLFQVTARSEHLHPCRNLLPRIAIILEDCRLA